MKSSLIFLFYIIILAYSCTTQPKEKEVDIEKPNILFIMTDDHSYQTFSAYDSRFIQTPNLDRIAKEGVLFKNSFVTNSICAPSRAVMLTGKFNHLNGQMDNRIRFDSSQATFPKHLQKAGYETALVGKWHLKSQPMGFDHYEILIGQGNYYNTDFIENGIRKQSEGYVTNVITDKSLAWLDKRDKNKPFCLLLHHKATHRIWFPDTALFKEFEGVDFEVPSTFFDSYEGRIAAKEQAMSIAKDMDLVWDNKMMDKEGDIQTGLRKYYANRMYSRLNPEQKAIIDAYYNPIIEKFKADKLTGKELALWKYQRYMQDYLRCVRSVDNNVGRVLAYLDENGLAENTLVVYTSDQGFYMGEHGWFDKRFMYEPSLRTPLVMRFPKGINAQKKVEELVQNIDYAPTIMDLAGLDIPAGMQGKSLIPLLKTEKTGWRDAIYYQYYEYPGPHSVKRHYGIRTERYKLIHFYNDIDTWEFFDLETDPEEMHNLYEKSEYADLISTMKGRLGKLRTTYQVSEDGD